MARILVIDDDALLRGAIRVVLESAGYEVIEAGDGDAGLRLHRELGADLVVVDLFMPERDGLEVIRAVRAEAPQAKIIAMSGGSSLQLDLLDAATAFGARPVEAVCPRSAASHRAGTVGRARALTNGCRTRSSRSTVEVAGPNEEDDRV